VCVCVCAEEDQARLVSGFPPIETHRCVFFVPKP
jgi:hypothetical protein